MPTTTTTTDAASEAKASLFDVTEFDSRVIDEGVIQRVPLDEIELAPNPRKDMTPDGIERLAKMMMRSGQLVPCIGRRNDETDRVLLYDGQRRFVSAKASQGLASTDGYEGLRPLASLIVLLLDHEPTPDELRRIQAQANAREELSRHDQQEQFRDCWEARTGISEDDRMVLVCEDLGISPKLGHSLRRELNLPEEIRQRVSVAPRGDQISPTLAGRLSDMHDVAPQLACAVAGQIVTRDLHDKALRDPAGFIHKTLVHDSKAYARRLDDGAALKAADEVEQARQHLGADQQRLIATALTNKAMAKARDEGKDDQEVEKAKVEVEKLDEALDRLAAQAKAKSLTIRVDANMRERARNIGCAWVEAADERFADSIWVVDPTFLLCEVIELVDSDDGEYLGRDERFFGGGKVETDDMKAAEEEARQAQEAARKRAAAAYQANLGLGLDLRSGLMEPKDRQLHALKAIVCHLLVERYGQVIAFGAGWSDQERMQPVGDGFTGRLEPRQPDAIIAGELQRALEDPDPLKGIWQLVARFGAAFVLDLEGVTKGKALGSHSMERKLREALPGGDSPLRTAIWEFMRPMLSPHLVERNHDAFVSDSGVQSSVDLEAARADTSIDDLDLGEDDTLADAA